ncbi:MAG TPA: PepSY domain-containing protein [Candidatus Kapabacteria bacterium]|nr:PepSY domain-containing protein [Candidatus Kapabacteria bacterium]
MNSSIYLAGFILIGPVLAQSPSPIQPHPVPIGTPATPTEQAAPGPAYLATDYTYDDLPPAVQEFLHFRFGGQKITDIDRESRNGQPVWEIEFEEPGRNQEIHVDQEGIFIPEHDAIVGRPVEETVPTSLPGPIAVAAGIPPGFEIGSGVYLENPTWESLPTRVQQRATQFGGKANVRDIDRETEDGLVHYEIEFRREGWNLEIDFAEDGSIIESNDLGVAVPEKGSAITNSAASAAPAQASQSQQVTR